MLVLIEIENVPSFCNTKSQGRFMADLIWLPQGKTGDVIGTNRGKGTLRFLSLSLKVVLHQLTLVSSE